MMTTHIPPSVPLDLGDSGATAAYLNGAASPEELQARANALIDQALAEGESHQPGDGERELAGGKILEIRRAESLPNGMIRARLSVLDGQNIPVSRSVLFDDGADEYQARKALNLSTETMAEVERGLREAFPRPDTAYPNPARGAIVIERVGDLEWADPRWLVYEILPADCLAVLIAKEASYKSFVALGLAAAIQTGREWAGHPVEAGMVLYLTPEGAGTFHKRTRAWEIANRESLAEMRVIRTAVDFLDPQRFEALTGAIGRLDTRPVLIVVDTLNRSMIGNENDTEDMTRFIAACDTLRTLTGATVLIVHHENRQGTYRGSSALVAAVDCQIDAERDGDTVALKSVKMKDAPEFDPLWLKAHVVELGKVDRFGKPITSLVMRPTDVPPGAPPAASDMTYPDSPDRPLHKSERLSLNALIAAGGCLTYGDWRRAAMAANVNEKTFERAVKHLVRLGKVAKNGDTYSPIDGADDE